MPPPVSLLARSTAAALALTACTTLVAPVRTGRVPSSALTTLPRPLTGPERDVRDAANRFAFSLFSRLSAEQPGENVFVSPFSVSTSLGMVMNGAAGETRAQMLRTLGYGEVDVTAMRRGYRDLSRLLGTLDPATSFQIANSIWYAQDYPLLPSFLDAGRTVFDAEIRGVSFRDPGTRDQVNEWVGDRTNGRIPRVLESVRPSDVMYLINAVWFKGSWRTRFDPRETRDAPFHAADGTTATVPLMQKQSDTATHFRHVRDATVEAGELPYGNDAFALTILLPPAGTSIDAFAAALTPDRWNALIGALRPTAGMLVALPRFTLAYGRQLNPDLQALGMTDAFDPQRADLTGMSTRRDLYVEYVMHRSFLLVDEEGTEAAAVTNTAVGVTSLPPSFRVDRPFVFAIRERLSGTVLFIGKVTRLPAAAR